MRKRKIPIIASAIMVTGVLLPGSIGAESENDDDSSVLSETEESYNELNSNSDVENAMKFIKSDDDNTLDEQIELTEIPAPPYHEEEKAEAYKDKLDDLGLEDVHIDDTGNVIGTMEGSGDGPTLAIDAHLDIAFEEGVDTEVEKDEDGILHAPGISDDTRALASLLSVIRAYNEEDIQPVGDIKFIGTVGEEDDFRGVDNYLEEHHDDIDGYVSVEGGSASSIKHGGTAGSTVEFEFEGPGGHAWGNNDRPSATHAAGRATAEIADFGEEDPKTTFNVGTINGGTVENAKAEKASMLTEFRTDGPDIDENKQKLIDAVENGVKEENERWDKDSEDGVTVDTNTKIDIPGGEISKDEPIVQAATASVKATNEEPEYRDSGMTNSNYGHEYNLPTMNIGGGGEGGNAHSLDEWFDPTDAYIGPQQIFMTLLGLTGMDDVTDPLLGDEGDDGDGDNGDEDDSGLTIDNLEPEEDVDLQTGDSVKIEMDSDSGLHPTFAIRMPLTASSAQLSSSVNEFPMSETSDGHYVGYWTVPSGLKAKGAEPQVMVNYDDDNETRKEADGKLNINVADK